MFFKLLNQSKEDKLRQWEYFHDEFKLETSWDLIKKPERPENSLDI